MLFRSIAHSVSHRLLPRKSSIGLEERPSSADPAVKVHLDCDDQRAHASRHHVTQDDVVDRADSRSCLWRDPSESATATELQEDKNTRLRPTGKPLPSSATSSIVADTAVTAHSTSPHAPFDHFRSPATSPLPSPTESTRLDEPTVERPPSPTTSVVSAPAVAPRMVDEIDLFHTPSFEHEDPIMQRKIWVKRPGAATNATQVTVNDDDLVDTVRDAILRKYANSLGKAIDSPDVSLRIIARDQGNRSVPVERELSPDEQIGYVLDQYYPGGQTIAEALVIDVPEARTPKKSPRINNYHAYAQPYPYYAEHLPPLDQAREYFPVMPAVSSPHLQHPPPHAVPANGVHPQHGLLLNPAAAVRPLPSPGARSARWHPKRPTYGRTHTSSPTVLHTTQGHLELQTQVPNGISPNPPPLPTPPVTEHRSSITPPHRPVSPPPGHGPRTKKKPKQSKPTNGALSLTKSAPTGLLYGTLPAINVLIVEDNVINLRLLEAFMKRLKVRWKTATDGKQAVEQWRKGGFHLVLMDLKMPVMNGLEATKEIRRLEGVNGIGIGVFGGTSSYVHPKGEGVKIEDKLGDISLFKSPVIIVALTASSLQSDRHEALAAGCNDFLTKPVNYPWMERKVTEWGCMQALIDFDGWRRWKAGAQAAAKKEAGMTEEEKKKIAAEEKAKAREAIRAQIRKGPPPSKKKDDAAAAVTTTAATATAATPSVSTATEAKSNHSNSIASAGIGKSPTAAAAGTGGSPSAAGAGATMSVAGPGTGPAPTAPARRITSRLSSGGSSAGGPGSKLETHPEEDGEEDDEK